MKKIRLPRPATVIACLALAFALGGTAAHAANTVRSSDIVDGEVRSRDVMNRNLKGNDIADNSIGNRVLAPSSVTSEQLDGIFTVTANSAATGDADGTTNGGQHSVAAATANCPAGSDLISGGARWVENTANNTNNSAVYLQEQFRSGGGNSWTAEGVVDLGAQGTIKLQAQAYCLAAGPLT